MKKLKVMGVILLTFIFSTTNVKALTLTEDTTLTEDITEQVIVSESTVTINLNGHKIKAAANGALSVINNAKVTVNGPGTIESTNSNGVVVNSGATLTLESGNIKSVEFGVATFGNATFIMNGGQIDSSDNCGVGGNGSDRDNVKNYTITINDGIINGSIKTAGYVSCGIYHPNKGTVNINGGTINSLDGAGIVQRAGTLNITGGTINAKGNKKGKVGDSRVVVDASAVVIDKEANYPEMATMITKISANATLNGQVEDIKTIGNDVAIEITGGVYTKEPISEQIPEGYNAYKVLDGENEDKYVVVKEEELEAETVSGQVTKEELPKEEVSLIEETLKDRFQLASFYGVGLLVVTPNGDVVEYVEEANEPVEVKLGIPTTLPEVKTGFIRKYYVIRVHNGEVTIIDNVKINDDGTISFQSDKFSTYALAYDDVKEEKVLSPATYDGITPYIVLAIITFLSLPSMIYLKRKIGY